MPQSFSALGVSAEVEQALAARGIVEPFHIQSLVVPDALEGRDILGKAPTGSGKTLAFGLPIVELVSAGDPAPAALVLAPTRELALQVTEELVLLGKPKGIRAAAAYGGAPVGAQVKRLRGAQVVVATPGRLNDLVQRRLISLESVRILILDEADRMLDMGFQPRSTGSFGVCRPGVRRCSFRPRSTGLWAGSPRPTRSIRRGSRPSCPHAKTTAPSSTSSWL